MCHAMQQKTTPTAWLGIQERNPRGWLDEGRTDLGRVGEPTQHHAQGSTEHQNGNERFPQRKPQNRNLPWKGRDFDESHKEKKFAEEFCISQVKSGWEVGDTDSSYGQ
jgi:hypothetical protein